MNKIYTVALASAVVIGVSGCNQTQVDEPQKVAQTILQVVQLGDSTPDTAKHFSGIVRSQEQAALAFRVPGTIEQIYVSKGDTVTQGQVIARLDPHDYQLALEEMEAKMLEARSAHKLAKVELKRIKQATHDDAIASVNLDRAVSGYERSLSAVKVVEKNIQRAKDTLSYTQLKAPFDGVIGRIDFEQHEQILPGIALGSLQDNMQLEVEIDVPETLIEAFEIGQIGAASWYGSEQFLNAYVTEIAPLPHLIKQTYTVTYRIEKGNAHLFPGKSISISTHIGNNTTDYCIPYSALVGHKEQMHINLIRENKVVYTQVELNSLDAYQACVKGDLNADDYVVVSGSHYLSDGQSADKFVIRRQ
ncbi:efflux RND transporter periplasmic adaptor subunit [Vibrio kasasachensis]|uniref:efflux RND transporter periplasmic adaptor subunit n=1 Tax=Vibrio kasasachensis TaxID=2910248 RepID=UPI003D0E00AA